MKLATATILASALTFGIGAGIAQAAQPLDSKTCNKAWSMASPDGKTLSQGQAVDYVLNFTMVDSDQDGQISQDEFNAACDKGMVKADAATLKDMQ